MRLKLTSILSHRVRLSIAMGVGTSNFVAVSLFGVVMPYGCSTVDAAVARIKGREADEGDEAVEGDGLASHRQKCCCLSSGVYSKEEEEV